MCYNDDGQELEDHKQKGRISLGICLTKRTS